MGLKGSVTGLRSTLQTHSKVKKRLKANSNQAKVLHFSVKQSESNGSNKLKVTQFMRMQIIDTASKYGLSMRLMNNCLKQLSKCRQNMEYSWYLNSGSSSPSPKPQTTIKLTGSMSFSVSLDLREDLLNVDTRLIFLVGGSYASSGTRSNGIAGRVCVETANSARR